MVREWWRDAVVYEVYVRSFADSDGDGVGDLEGIRARLPHLVALGVDAVWLTPFYPSPMADHGYDVADYCDVEPLFGDLAAFDRLLAEAHAQGLRVIVDIVPNHTSSAHPWFQQALADPASPLREPLLVPRRRRTRRLAAAEQLAQRLRRTGVDPRVAGRRSGTSTCSTAPSPTSTGATAAVHEEFLRILRFWLDRGVDGFRIDVAHSLYKRQDMADDPRADIEAGLHDEDHRHVWDRDEVLAVYEEWRQVLDGYDGDRMMVGEVFLFDVPRVARYVGPRAAAPGVQLHRVQGAVGREGPARDARARAGALRPGHLGAVQPRPHPARHPLRRRRPGPPPRARA